MKLKLFFFLLLISYYSFSQGEANNWFFGQNVGLRFNEGSKPVVQNGALNTIEGCTSISDSDGNLLFYTDGITVYNRKHQVMQNGNDLKGHSSSTQSAIVAPHPIDENIYYLFTVGEFRDPGFHYYTVDMSLNGGDGAIVGGPVDLDPSGGTYSKIWSEKISAIKSDECDYWVLSMVENIILAYKIDENGVNTTPVISSTTFFCLQLKGIFKIFT